jgi:hypothetical protein
MMLGLAVHDAFGWKGRRERFCSAKHPQREGLGDRGRDQRHGARGGNRAGNDARGLTAAAACGASAPALMRNRAQCGGFGLRSARRR